jgi:uncharacterized protein YigE (DUF2233 family)
MPALVLILLLFAACQKSGAYAELPQSACRQQTFEGDRFTVCDPSGGKLELFVAGPREQPLRSFAEVGAKVGSSKVSFAMNAGMFDENGRPIGLAKGTSGLVHAVNLRDGSGNFSLKPNGVFIVTSDGTAMIVPSDHIPSFRAAPQLETQSGPLLVIDGKLHPKLQADGPSRYIRNGVGVRGGKPLFVISDDPVSFGKLARFFRDALKTPNALYFDGAVSSLWDPANGRQDAHAQLGPIIVAFKPEASKPGPEGRARP